MADRRREKSGHTGTWADDERAKGGGGTSSPLASVVDVFIRDEAGFTPKEVCRYVNQAIRNEAVALWRDRQTLRGEATSLENEHNTTDVVGRGTGSVHRPQEVVTQFDQRYDAGRVALAQVIGHVWERGMLALDPETCRWIQKLDHDGMMSRQVDVAVLNELGSHLEPIYMDRPSRQVVQEIKEESPSGVDYSRKLIADAGAFEEEEDRLGVPIALYREITTQHAQDGHLSTQGENVSHAAVTGEIIPQTWPSHEHAKANGEGLSPG